MESNPRLDEFETAAVPHFNELYRVASRVLGNRSDAGDVVQETFLQAWKCFDRFETGTNCRAWLYKILFNVIRQSRRKAWRFNRRFVYDDDDRTIDETLGYLPLMGEHLDEKRVSAAFEKLPEAYREIVLLVDVHELAYREAAEALDVPIGKVMSRLSRARSILRGELADLAAAYGIGETSCEKSTRPREYVVARVG